MHECPGALFFEALWRGSGESWGTRRGGLVGASDDRNELRWCWGGIFFPFIFKPIARQIQ